MTAPWKKIFCAPLLLALALALVLALTAMPAQADEPEELMRDYQIRVTTQLGVSGQVWVSVVGRLYCSDFRLIGEGLTAGTYETTLSLLNLGEPVGVRVYQEGGDGAWSPLSISVDGYNGLTKLSGRPLGQLTDWSAGGISCLDLGRDPDSGFAPEANGGQAAYIISFQTGGGNGAGSDGTVTMTLYGSKGSCELGEEWADTYFYDGSWLSFEVEAADIGEPLGVELRFPDNPEDSTWQCDYVMVNGHRFNFSRVWFGGEVTAAYAGIPCFSDRAALESGEDHSHRWLAEEAIALQEPVCGQSGLNANICDICGYRQEEETSVEHERDGQWRHDQEGHWQTCLHCGQPLGETAHELRITEQKRATGRQDGFRTYSCLICGYTYTEILPMLTEEELAAEYPMRDLTGKAAKLPQQREFAPDNTLVLAGATALAALLLAVWLLATRRREAAAGEGEPGEE